MRYGSSDTARAICKRGGIVPLISHLSKHLHLKPHIVVEHRDVSLASEQEEVNEEATESKETERNRKKLRAEGRSFLLEAAVDVEGHFGEDRLYYIVCVAFRFVLGIFCQRKAVSRNEQSI